MIIALGVAGCGGDDKKASDALRRSRSSVLSSMRQLRDQKVPNLSPVSYLFGDYRQCGTGGSVRYVSGTGWTSSKHGYKNPSMLKDAELFLSQNGWSVGPGAGADRRTVRKDVITIDLLGVTGQFSIKATAYSPCFRVGKASRGFLQAPGDEFGE
jgi:hypothetical protein